MTTTIHLVFVRGFSPLLFLLLLSGHLLLNKHNSCLALRFTDEQDTFNDDAWVDEELTAKRLFNDDEQDSDFWTSLNREIRKPSKKKLSDDAADTGIDRLSRLNTAWNADNANSQMARLQSSDALDVSERRKRRNDALFLVVVGTCSLVGVLGLVAAAIFWYKIQKRAEAALDAEYPSYGVTGPSSSGSKISPSSTITDRKLAQSAQMFHYQQQRQQMMAQEKAHLDAKPVHSDDSDDEAPNGGDYTVYECPGLAPTGEMEVRNPLFAEPDPSLGSTTSLSHPTTNNHYPQPTTSVPSSSPPKEKSLS